MFSKSNLKMWLKYLTLLFLVLLNLVTAATNDSKPGKDEGRVLPGPVIPLLLVPPTAPTRHQLIWGVGIPNQLNFESLVYGLVLKAQYYLADTINNPSNFKIRPSTITFPGFGFMKKRRAIRDAGWDNEQQMKYENYTGEIEVVTEEVIREINTARESKMIEEMKSEKEEEEAKGMTRWDLYSVIEAAAKQYEKILFKV